MNTFQPRKKRKYNRKPKRNQFLLSKSATAIYQTLGFPKEICNLIGQFLGTDIEFYKVGDVYVLENTSKDLAMIKTYAEQGYPHVVLTYKLFHVYQVIRRTACRLKVKRITIYEIYSPGPSKWTYSIPGHNIVVLKRDMIPNLTHAMRQLECG